jgi:hypothetical protein
MVDTAFYNRLADTSNELIEKFGQDITIEKVTTTYDPQTNQSTTSKTQGTFKGTVRQASQQIVDGENIKFGDLEVVLSPKNLPFTPEQNQKIIIDGKNHNITAVQKTAPGSIAVIYRVFARAI